MASVKEIQIKVIPSNIANDFVRRVHYSGKVVNNSKLHFGAFLNGHLHGVLSFGAPFDKSKVLGLVKNTGWNEMMELNRMAFDDTLPKNSESRCIAVCLRLIKKNAPHMKWILSFADGTQCGDGTIYRASGFILTQIKKNNSIIKLPNGDIRAKMTFTKGKHILKQQGRAGVPEGSQLLAGHQLRYIYLLDKNAELNCPIIPFSQIQEKGAKMYKGKQMRE